MLADYFLQKHAVGGRPKKLTPASVDRLMNHDWPGNVRELENLMQNAAAMSRLDHIPPEDLAFARDAVSSNAFPKDWTGLPYEEAMARAERALLADALARSDGNRSMAAKRLGLYRQRFYAKLRLYGLL
jgi:two-component system NtrC family response regulator